jgi:hypothetical protein
MKKNIITILTVLALSTLAHARIGETVAQCDARYGELVRFPDANGDRHYNKNGFAVFASFSKDGKCAAIFYCKLNDEKISALELKALMRANGKGWVSQNKLADFDVWISDNKKAYLRNEVLTIKTLAHIDYEIAEDERKKAEKLNEF